MGDTSARHPYIKLRMSLTRSKFKIEYNFFRSRVAQRIFFLFVLCALFPLSALTYFSFSQVTKQLNQQANQRLHQANKTAGMAIIERLLFLEADLKIISANLKVRPPDVLESVVHEFHELLQDRFKGFVLVTGSDRTVVSLESISILPQLSKDEQQHVTMGASLLVARPKPDGFADIFIVRALDPAQPPQKILFGEINAEYLWGGKDFLLPMTELFAIDESEQVLFSSFQGNIPLPELKKTKNSAFGYFEWTYGDDKYLATYRTLFMTPQFATNWILIHSQSRADILEPLDNFKKFFSLVILLSFWTVLLLSLIQIRRSLVPIEMLREATQKIAVKDFGSRLQINSNDEFEQLGKTFNDMAENLENHLKTMATINRIGMALSDEKDIDRLLETILLGAKSIINADGAALYIITKDQQLKLSVMHIESLDFTAGEMSKASIPLYDKMGNPNTMMVIAYSALNRVTINIWDIYTQKGIEFLSHNGFNKKITTDVDDFDFSDFKEYDASVGYKTRSILVVPMLDRMHTVVGVLQLMNSINRKTGETTEFSSDQVETAYSLASQAAIAIENAKNYEKIQRKNIAFERFVPIEFLHRLGKSEIEDITLGDVSREELSILFSDIRSFTSLSETMTPDENFRFLNSYLKHIGPIIAGNGGFIDKYIGDAIMALFSGNKIGVADDAVAAAVGMIEQLKDYNKHRQKSGYRPITIGIGIHTGPLMLGTIGFEKRMENTVIGDTVNLASRVEELTKEYGTPIIITAITYQQLVSSTQFLVRQLDTVQIKGKTRVSTIYEIFNNDPDPIKELKLKTLDTYHESINLYREGKWHDALQLFTELQTHLDADKVIEIYVERCRSLLDNPPDELWDGVTKLDEK